MLTRGFVCEDLPSKQLSLQNMHISFFPKELTRDYRSQEVPTSAVSKLGARRLRSGCKGRKGPVSQFQGVRRRPACSVVCCGQVFCWLDGTHTHEGGPPASLDHLQKHPTDTSITWEQIPGHGSQHIKLTTTDLPTHRNGASQCAVHK